MRKIRLCSMIFLIVLIIACLNIPRVRFLIVSGEEERVKAVFQASADTYIDQEDPDNNYGSSEYLKVRSLASKNARTYVFFNLSTIPRSLCAKRETLPIPFKAPGLGKNLSLLQVKLSLG